MPMFNTGNAQWDQGLNTLGGALFPDPSKVAQAGYYGAEARKAQIDAAKLQEQMAYRHRLDIMSGGTQPPTANYAPTGPLSIPILQDPTQSQAAPAPPPTASPSLSAVVVGPPAPAPPPPPAPAAAPPPPAPPVAGTVGANLPPGGLSALFAQGGGAVPQPTVVGQGPNGGAIVQPTMTPSEVADRTPAIVDAHPNLTQGTPPPVSSPAPSAPPAPNTTGSDGSVPGNDASSGTFHPGSITPPGGGRKTTGPANADGSPARPAPMFTQAQYVATAVNSGMDAAQATVQWRSYIQSLYDKGILDENSYHHAMGSTDPSIINTDATNAANIRRTGIEQAGATTRTAMTEAGATTRQNIVTDEQRMQFQNAEVAVRDPTDPSKAIIKKRKDLQPGDIYYDSAQAVQAGKPTAVVPPGGGPPVNIPAYQTTQPGPGQPSVFEPNVAAEQQRQKGAFGDYMDLKDPSAPHYTTADTAERQGLVPRPQSSDQWNARMQQAIALEPDPVKQRDLIDRYTAVAALPKATTPKEAFDQQQVDYQSDQRAYPQPQHPLVPLGVTNPIAFTPQAQTEIDRKTEQLQRSTSYLRNNPVLAHQRAVQELQADGTLYSPDEINELRKGTRASLYGAGDVRVSSYQAPGDDKATDHLMIGLKKGAPRTQQNQPVPPQNQPVQQQAPVAQQPPAPVQTQPPSRGAPGKSASRNTPPVPPAVPDQPLPPRPVPPVLSGIIAGSRPTGASTAPLGAIGAAPPGAVENQIVHGPGGVPGVVHGNLVYPLAAR
jgi:hypothetical protein